MVELIVGTYGLACWLVFKKFKLVPVTTYTVCTAIFGGVVILGLLFISLSVYHPVSHDGRMYAPVVQIVPQVRGTVIEIPVEANKPVKKGDVLFKIDPQPFKIEVERLRSSLAVKNRDFAKLADQLAAAEAATKKAQADLLVSESVNDRQLRETHEQAKSNVIQVEERLKLAKVQLDRAKDGKRSGVISGVEYDRAETHFQTLDAEFVQAKSAERNAAEELRRGSASLEGARQEVARLEAAERQVRREFDTQIEGENPDVRETMALLAKARWDLDQTIVRAPTDGYVPQQLLRPGMMAVPLPLKPLMMYVVNEQPTLVATYPQKVISDIKPGLEGEAVFKAYPGRSFKVKVRRVLTAIREGEMDASGQLATATPEHAPGYIPVVFDYDEDISGLNLPVGAQASIAIYTDRVHALSIVRKIILRIKSWENYVF
ncbi:MAG: biotin/lipoyl-binding protein [Planctomycetia bacterium]|nr:biotin/lipoyl-binding protein [Planctomycetia bacterium]